MKLQIQLGRLRPVRSMFLLGLVRDDEGVLPTRACLYSKRCWLLNLIGKMKANYLVKLRIRHN